MEILPRYTAPDFSAEKFVNSPDAAISEVLADGIAPKNYHATSMYPEYFKINGKWRLIEHTRMDCVPVLRGDTLEALEFRKLKVGDRVLTGRSDDGTEGIYLHSTGFVEAGDSGNHDAFAFRSGRTRETSFHGDYESLIELLRHDSKHGRIIWVLGPAAVFSDSARKAMEYIIDNGYAHAVFGGNAVVTHDLEGAMFGTALGQDIRTRENIHNGHYHHLDVINEVNRCGSISAAVAGCGLNDGVICACLRNNVPFVLAGSLRDDGPLEGVINDMSRAQDAMREHTTHATTVICLATQLHTIATGNLTASYVVSDGKVRPVFIYAVDISEFVLNKLRDRGSLEVTTIVSNIQDFLFKLTSMLK